MNKKRLIIYGACVVLAIFVFIIFYRPMMVKMGDAQRQMLVVEGQLFDQRGNVAVLKNLKLKGRLMRQGETSFVINEITEKGGELGLEFISITPGELRKTEQGSLKMLPISFKIESGYKGLGEFLVYLEEFSRTLTEVKELAVWMEEEVAPELSVRLLVNLYMEADDGEK
jgi:Tfp pilus assembly protein PilO